MVLKEVEWESVNCIHLAQDREDLMNTIMNLQVP
jgi:hypothetical protein